MPKEAHKQATVYGLVDPRTQAIHYIGVTTLAPEARLQNHISTSLESSGTYGYNRRKVRWIQELALAGLRPTIRCLKTVAANEGKQAEKEAIIEHFKSGADLFNKAGLNEWLYARKATNKQMISGLVGDGTYTSLQYLARSAGVSLPDYVGKVLEDATEPLYMEYLARSRRPL